MSSGRNRDYRKPYSRGNVSRNAWQPYPPRRTQFTPQRSRRSEEEDDIHYEARLIDLAPKVFSTRVEFERSPQSSMLRRDTYEGRAKVIVLRTYGVSEPSHVVRTPSRSPISSPIKSSCSGVKYNGVKVEPINGVKVEPINGVKVEPINGIKVEQNTEGDEDPDGPPVPKVSLFPENRIVLGWKKSFSVGAGMANLGNTCYLNATLQALFHIPSFCNWLMSELDQDENSGCKELDDNNGEKCIICAMATTLKIVRSKNVGIVKPYLIYNRLKSICKHMSYGRQEDAHEFLRYLLEKMELSYLERYKGKQLENASKETTPVHRIFGGYLRSEISCNFCKGTSTTFQHFQDLMLDIRRSSSLDDALSLFFSRESLEGDDGGVGGEGGDAYKCGKCHLKGHCVKRSSIQTAPKVLCIQLKRFSALGGKLVKHISYPEKLDMSPYLDSRHPGQFNSSYGSQRPLMYHLTSIVSHSGASMNSGHYTATAKAPSGEFYEFDDTYVHQASLHGSLEANAYILMYEMIPTREESQASCTPLKSTTSVYTSNGLSMPPEKMRPFVMPTNRPKMICWSSRRPLNGAMSSVPSFSSTSTSGSNSTSNNSSALPPAKEREKVYFDIKSPNHTSSSHSLSSQSSRASVSKSHLEYSQSSPRKLSPEPKSQSPVSRTSPKVNGVCGNPAKTNGSQPAISASWNPSAAKSVRQPAKFPYSPMDNNQMHTAVSGEGSNGREGAEKSLDRLSKLGVLVGVSGKGRDAECLAGKADHHHLVSYPILSGESSDEEEERRGAKRSRKCSESGLPKLACSASEMTISGNLTADATAIAASRGWNINGSTVAKGGRDLQKTVDNSRVAEVSSVRKDLPNGNRAELLVMNGRERTEKSGGSGVCSKSDVKKLNSLEEGEKGEGSAAASTVNERLEERPNGTSRPSSPCSSASSSSLESCSVVMNGSTEFKSILKIIDRSNCGMIEDSDRKATVASPTKLKSLPNGTGNTVAGEGGPDAAKGTVGTKTHKNLGYANERSCRESLRCSLMKDSSRKWSSQAASEDRDVVSKIVKWLSECDFESCEDDCLNGGFLSPSPTYKNEALLPNYCDRIERLRSSLSLKERSNVSSAKKQKGVSRRRNMWMKNPLELKKSKRETYISMKFDEEFESDMILDIADRGSVPNIPSDSVDTGVDASAREIGKNQQCSDNVTDPGSVIITYSDRVDTEGDFIIREMGKNQHCSEVNRDKILESDSSSTDSEKVQRNSGASPVPVLGRSDARSLISNPS